MEIQKQQQLMKMVEVLEMIRPDGKRREKEKRGHRIHPSAKRLLCILLHEESINQRNIANRINLTPQAVSEILKKLEGRELIRKQDGEINNENIVYLTEKGDEIAKGIEVEMQKYAEQIFLDFTEEELQELEHLLDKLYANRIQMNH